MDKGFDNWQVHAGGLSWEDASHIGEEIAGHYRCKFVADKHHPDAPDAQWVVYSFTYDLEHEKSSPDQDDLPA